VTFFATLSLAAALCVLRQHPTISHMLYRSEVSTALAGKKVLVWLRRDLRLDDHAALAFALGAASAVFVAFVFDRDILDRLLARGLKRDRRVEFIHHAVCEIDAALAAAGSRLLVREGNAPVEIARLATRLGVDMVLAHRDYEPLAIARDQQTAQLLREENIGFLALKDQVIFEGDELRTESGNFYSVFTPYRRAWLAALSAADYAERKTDAKGERRFARPKADLLQPIPSLSELGFESTNLKALGLPLGQGGAARLLAEFETRIDHYRERRDYPAVKGPSYLSVHLRFGTLSVRAMVRAALRHIADLDADGDSGARTWLSELIWRDFYAQILYHRPDVTTQSFRPAYDDIAWREGAEAARHFDLWATGATGYPIVDAAMRQINSSGYMHNRLRMITASFLVKDLGIDWRRGEAYFADQLNDYDLASNNGGWQWSASTGCDAQPFFRIFNPVTQSEKFDPHGKFIRLYVPELAGLDARQIHAPWRLAKAELEGRGVVLGTTYPMPIVDHETARKETLARYQKVRKDKSPPQGAPD
jgi:deoxyribodipyrimidine photo-lyase